METDKTMSAFTRTKKRIAPPLPKVNRVDAVLGSDLHIRPDVPVCRTDDYQKAMWKKLDFIFDLCRKHEAPFLCGGDIGHRPQWPNWMLERFIRSKGNVKMISALGQHDLPAHNIEELDASACGILNTGKHVEFNNTGYIDICHWVKYELCGFGLSEVLITHRLVTQRGNDWPGMEAITAKEMFKQYPQYKLILTGDNHISFVEEYQGRLLVNPGSMMRNTAAQADHHPRVYLWDSAQNIVEPVYLPIEEGVVDRAHIDVKEERDDRMAALTERVKLDYNDEFSYEDNMIKNLKDDPAPQEVEQKILRAMGR